jgi:hypothetical protein
MTAAGVLGLGFPEAGEDGAHRSLNLAATLLTYPIEHRAVFVLKGAYIKTERRRTGMLSPFTLNSRPAGERHVDTFPRRADRCSTWRSTTAG